MVELDGGYLEGGGQILRTAVGLSALTGEPCRIFNIRSGRSNPGLRAQHLRGIEALAELCGAELTGAEIGSPEIAFRPRGLNPPEHVAVHVGTAGAVTLVLQALMIPLARSPHPVSLDLTGGTHVRWAPVVEYFDQVFGHYLRRAGCALKVSVRRCGFYPQGGGKVRVTVTPGTLRGLDLLTRGSFQGCTAVSVAAATLKKARVAERQLDGVARVLELDEQQAFYTQSPSTGTAIFLRARYDNCVLGASALGERGKLAEEVGRECGAAMRDPMRTEASLDKHMADQIIPYMAVAEGDSRVSVEEITNHCRTNIWVVEQFLPVRFEMDEKAGVIACRHASE